MTAIHPSLLGGPSLDSPGPVALNDTGASQAKDTARTQLTQLVGILADNQSSQSTDLVAALDAIAAAINAKPSA